MNIQLKNPLEPKLMDKKTSDDRVLELQPIEGATVTTESGQTDNRLFKGENKLHVVKEPNTTLWFFRMDKGLTPGGLRGKFTSFEKAKVHAESYYKRRGVKITNIIE